MRCTFACSEEKVYNFVCFVYFIIIIILFFIFLSFVFRKNENQHCFFTIDYYLYPLEYMRVVCALSRNMDG